MTGSAGDWLVPCLKDEPECCWRRCVLSRLKTPTPATMSGIGRQQASAQERTAGISFAICVLPSAHPRAGSAAATQAPVQRRIRRQGLTTQQLVDPALQPSDSRAAVQGGSHRSDLLGRPRQASPATSPARPEFVANSMQPACVHPLRKPSIWWSIKPRCIVP